MPAMRELPIPVPPTTAPAMAAAYAIAVLDSRSKHGLKCPVWERTADIGECDCWILRRARRDALAALAAARKVGGLTKQKDPEGS